MQNGRLPSMMAKFTVVSDRLKHLGELPLPSARRRDRLRTSGSQSGFPGIHNGKVGSQSMNFVGSAGNAKSFSQNLTNITIDELVMAIDRKDAAKERANFMQNELCEGLKTYNALAHMNQLKEKRLQQVQGQLMNLIHDWRFHPLMQKRNNLAQKLDDLMNSVEWEEFQGNILNTMKETRRADMIIFKKPLADRMRLLTPLNFTLEKEGTMLWGDIKQIEDMEGDMTKISFHHRLEVSSPSRMHVVTFTQERFDAENEALNSMLKVEEEHKLAARERKLDLARERKNKAQKEYDDYMYSMSNQKAYYEAKKADLLEKIGKLQKALGNDIDPRELPTHIILARYPDVAV
jgi:hypothetical protein